MGQSFHFARFRFVSFRFGRFRFDFVSFRFDLFRFGMFHFYFVPHFTEIPVVYTELFLNIVIFALLHIQTVLSRIEFA